MSLASLLTQTATIRTRSTTGRDRYNDPVHAFNAATTHPCRLERIASEGATSGAEPGDRDIQVTEWLLYLPAGVALTGRDQVTVDGRTFEVVGDPVVARGRAADHHVEARLRLVDE